MFRLEEIFESAPAISRNSEIFLIEDIFIYCSTKFKSLLEKLKNDIKMSQEKSYNDVISFINYANFNINEIDTFKISTICNKFMIKSKKILKFLRFTQNF
jgi:hypothetical protein